jgi:VWFA-related protein
MIKSRLFRAQALFAWGLFFVGATAQDVIFAAPHPSQVAQSPQTHAAASSVVVDVVVMDDNNHAVKGLRERDFHVFENNKLQPIHSFEVHDENVEAAASAAPSLSVNTFSNTGSSALGAINVVLLDQLNTSIQDQALALRELNTFLVRKPADAAFAIYALRSDDIACKPYQRERWAYGATDFEVPDWDSGCASMGRLLLVQGFTTDKDRLIAAIQGSDAAQPHPTWLRVGLSNLSWSGGCGFPPGEGLDSYNRGPAQVIDTTMPSLAQLSNLLRALPGRKSLIWMSDNFDAAPVPQPSDMWFPPKFKGWENTDIFSQIQMTHLAAGRIAQARVAIYPVDLTGRNKGIDVKRLPSLTAALCLSGNWTSNLYCPNALGNTSSLISPLNTSVMTPFPILPQAQSFHTCDEHGPKLDSMADQTGGRAFHTADNIQNALMQAADNGMNYYTLTYFPSKAKFDGKRRQIKVTLNGENYHLTYRKEYYADDPSTLNRSNGNSVADVYLPNPKGPMPWIPLRTAAVLSQSQETKDLIMPAMDYGMPESRDITFSAHLEPTRDFTKATPARMDQLQHYESFSAERIAKAMHGLAKNEKRPQRKGRTVLGPMDSLPQPDPVFIQPYSIDYSIPAQQLSIKETAPGKDIFKIEVAVLAYDALGKKVAGFKQDNDVSLSASELQGLLTSGYRLTQQLDVPDRTTVLRLAVRDVTRNKVGSLEVPIWAIQSPYRRKRLRLPMNVDKSAAEPERGVADSTP